jgi:hypothetical protein
MKITIDGLSPSQRILADVIWHMDSIESVDGFIRSLRPQTLQFDAIVAREMIVAAAMDQQTAVSPEVTELLDKLRY